MHRFHKYIFWNKTLHVSDSSSVHRQEFFFFHCTHSNGICHTGLLTACSHAVSKPVRVTSLIKINLCCVRLIRCGLFSNRHHGMASIKSATKLCFVADS